MDESEPEILDMEEPDQEEAIPDPVKEKNQTVRLLISVVAIVVIFLVLFNLKSIIPSKSVTTIEDVRQDVLQGKETNTSFLYNGFTFVKVGNLWYTEVQYGNKIFNVPLHFNPKEVEDIPVTGKVNDSFTKKTRIYITFNPTEERLDYTALTAGELSLSLVKAIGAIPISSCDRNETDACLKVPIVTCNDTDKAVIYLQTNNESAIKLNGNCIILQGKDEGLLKAADKLLYFWYGVI